MSTLTDVAAERAVLAGLSQYGHLMYLEIGHLLSFDCFSSFNQSIFKCLYYIYGEKKCSIDSVDLPTLQSAAKEVGVSYIFEKPTETNHIQAILSTNVRKGNIKRFAQKIRKLAIARTLCKQLDDTKERLYDLTGDESISQIINVAEDGIFNFSQSLGREDSDTPKLVGENIDKLLEEVCSNPVDQLGLSTNFPIYDKAIGGGLQPGVHLIGARMKVGKTMLGMNMGYNVASKVPVLYCDSEMTEKQFKFRCLAMMSKIDINKIATGQVGGIQAEYNKVMDNARKLATIPLKWISINGMPFEQQLAMIRKWIIQDVGLLPNGKSKPCCIVYDYIKLNDSGDLKGDLAEFQLLGFMTNSLHNICVKYDIPALAFTQLNRDGIAGEDTDVIAGSDRVAWAVSSFSIFKKKSDEEIATDGPKHGNRKLVPLFSRNGGGLADREYICCDMLGWCGKISEGRTNLEIANGMKNGTNEGFRVEVENQSAVAFNSEVSNGLNTGTTK